MNRWNVAVDKDGWLLYLNRVKWWVAPLEVIGDSIFGIIHPLGSLPWDWPYFMGYKFGSFILDVAHKGEKIVHSTRISDELAEELEPEFYELCRDDED